MTFYPMKTKINNIQKKADIFHGEQHTETIISFNIDVFIKTCLIKYHAIIRRMVSDYAKEINLHDV